MITVYRASNPFLFVLADDVADGDVLVCEGIASEEQRAEFLASLNGESESKKRGRPRKEEQPEAE